MGNGINSLASVAAIGVLMPAGAAGSEDWILKKTCPAKACEKGGGGIVLPIFGDPEVDWGGIRIVLYLLGLLWFFMGVAVVADVFMGAIEKITSKKKRVFIDKPAPAHQFLGTTASASSASSAGQWKTVTVWNDTVANLTLMALGSSAPEILLGVIEIAGNEFYAGDLGPSTIVGSAAFNLFCITAVCVVAIPDGEKRTINDLGVFAVTATFSVFAYIWLFFIVAGWTPEVVTIEEAVITLLLFPVLVGIAFAADRGYFSAFLERKEPPRELVSIDDLSAEDIASLTHMVRSASKAELTDKQVARLIEFKVGSLKMTRARCRVGAIRDITGGGRVSPQYVQPVDTSKVVPVDDGEDAKTTVIASFVSDKYAVMEDCGTVRVSVQLTLMGALSELAVPIGVKYKTEDGTAKASSDYVADEGELIFKPGELQKDLEITIVNDDHYELDEHFSVKLLSVRVDGDVPKLPLEAQIGEIQEVQIYILDDDNPGTLYFEEESLTVQEEEHDKTVEINVLRKDGAKGAVSCKYKTEDDGAVSGRDFEPLDGTLKFENGQQKASISLVIKPRGRYESEECFRINLTEPTGGVQMDAKTDGGEDTCIMTVSIQADGEAKDRTDRIANVLRINWDKAQLGHTNWKEQFRDAIYPGGGGDDEGEAPGVMAWVMHIITVFWKVLFACIPPVDYCDGWLCFFMSLVMIGGVTMFIGDLASILGCLIKLPDAITAITFVALGTSLPDTFASKAAATQDPYADNSIGNVTGSNSVNVFLGIGISWCVGAFYWAGRSGNDWIKKYPGKSDEIRKVMRDYPDGGFAVKSGDLGFSVIVFCLCALATIGLLMFRRRSGIGELGGNKAFKYVTAAFLVFLWFLYVGLSSWKTFQTLQDDPCK